jgi:hypothetical protein
MINFNIFDDNIRNVKTGDLLFFSSNKITSSTVKLFLSTRYNHVGIAIRIKKGKIVMSGGKLYVLESNSKKRYDELTKEHIKGVALLKLESVFKDYDLIDVRHLDRSLIPPNFKKKTYQFIHKTMKAVYSNTIGSVLGVWLGCPIGGINRENNMFCSELVSYYYFDVLGSLTSFIKPGKLYSPNDFMEGGDMDFIFETKKEHDVIFIDQPNIAFTLNAPFIIGILLMVIVYMILMSVG